MTTAQATRTTKRTAARMFRTRNSLPLATREQMIVLLNQHLADTADLHSQSKQAHWNVRGPEFFQLHELFDALAGSVLSYADLIAERSTALGGEAAGTVRMAAAGSRLPEYPSDLRTGLEHVEALAKRYGDYANATRRAIDEAAKAGDQDTSDLLTEISRGVDQHLWFLEAHLQSE